MAIGMYPLPILPFTHFVPLTRLSDDTPSDEDEIWNRFRFAFIRNDFLIFFKLQLFSFAERDSIYIRTVDRWIQIYRSPYKVLWKIILLLHKSSMNFIAKWVSARVGAAIDIWVAQNTF